MAKKDEPVETVAAPIVQLFELSPEERKYIDASARKRAEEAGNQPDVEAEALRQRVALFDALKAKYPPSIGSSGMPVWRHADLGEVAYIEVAINGNYFDPRGAHVDYRPDLDVPVFGKQTGAVFLKS